jgi:hypothetical protein
MALLGIEGFEAFNTAGNIPSTMTRKYAATNRVSNTHIGAGRVAGLAWKADTSAVPYITTKDLGGTITTIIVGFAFKAERLSSQTFLKFFETGSVAGMELRLNSSGALSVYRTSTHLSSTASGIISANTWYYIEFKYTINNTTGSYTLKVNEEQLINETSKDTQQGGTADIDAVRFQGSALYPDNFWFDDVYICDDSGSVNNDFLGNCRVDDLLPNAAGDQTDFTPSAGSNYAAMDEVPPDDDTTYVESSTSTDQDLYNYTPMPTVGTIHGVQINTMVRETDASDFTLKTLIKTGTTTSADSAQAIAGQTYEVLRRVAEQDPDTSSAWTENGLNGAQFGLEVG